MKSTKAILGILVLLVITTSCATSIKPTPSREEMFYTVPMGLLGYPLGKYLTIEGFRSPGGDITGGHELMVDTVNGTKLPNPRQAILSMQLAKGVRYVVRGYESGGMVGIPEEVAEKEHMPLQQCCWGFRRSFVVTSIVEPKNSDKR